MLTDILKEILSNYRNSISIEQLKYVLNEKKVNPYAGNLINHNPYFKMSNGIVFLKEELIRKKKLFLNDFDDYIKSKVVNDKLKNNITDLIDIYIPDVLFVEWISIPLERKLIVFDLLFSIFIKPKRINDPLKRYFNKVLEFYSLIVVYSLIIVKYKEDDVELITNYITNIERYEEPLKNNFFNLLTAPDLIIKNFGVWYREYKLLESKIEEVLQDSFSTAISYSSILFRRVIEEELKNFEILSLFSRFETKTFYEWILILSDTYSDSDDMFYNDDFDDFE